MSRARIVVIVASLLLLPTSLCLGRAPAVLALAIAEAAVLAGATAYAVYLGIYRYPQ